MSNLIGGVYNLAVSYMREPLLQLICKSITYGRIELALRQQDTLVKERTINIGQKRDAEPLELTTSVEVTNTAHIWLKLCQNLDVIYIRNWNTLAIASTTSRLPLQYLLNLFKPINTTGNALKNASFHYDTSNELFMSFLSDEMCYSCPIWATPTEPLEAAQRRKVHTIIMRADIKSSHHILDIGGGWGFLAMEAVRLTGCRVTAITLSVEQKRLAEQRIREAAYHDRIDFLLCDYRNVPRPTKGYDRIVSVEMIEAVGKEFLDGYFRVLTDLLSPSDGRIVIQAITFIDKLHVLHKTTDNFLDRYIFPGGYLPSTAELVNCLTRGSDRNLELEFLENIGEHYVKALRLWRENFDANWKMIRASYEKEHGPQTDMEMEAFRRRWIYYFSYCEAGFLEGVLGDIIMVAVRKPRCLSSSMIL